MPLPICACQMALTASEGHVYAVERKEEAVALLEENNRKFRPGNMTVVAGTAPEACADLPAPTHVFVGGSAGSMRAILEAALAKNPGARIVATAITLESIGELTACAKEMGFEDCEVVSLSVARSRAAGRYHLMMGQNPIYVFAMQHAEGGEAK